MTTFLAVTDLHYCLRDDPEAERRNILSAAKLENIVGSSSKGCDFIIDLGDTADYQPDCGDQRELAKEVYGIMEKTGLPVCCAIGNHDTSLPKDELTDILHMPGRYYEFKTADFNCIVLDANMNSPETPCPGEEIEWGNTWFDPEQLVFLKDALARAGKPVLVFCHELFMLEYYEQDNPHVIRNRDEAIRLFEESGKVKAVFSGHYHPGDCVLHNGIYYLAFTALVLHENESFAVVKADKDRITVEGHDLQKSYAFELK